MKHTTIYALIVTAVLASLALGQGGVKPRISPVPLWPKDGNIPETLKNRNVFFSPETNEIVVSIEEPSGRKNLRFELRNQAEAVINSQVLKQQDGVFVYDYTVSAGSNSRRPLKTWSLLIPADDRQFDVKSSAAWRVEKRSTQMVDKQAARHAPLMYVDHSAPVGVGLSRGTSASGIRLVSSYLPGYVSSFARSDAQTILLEEVFVEAIDYGTYTYLTYQVGYNDIYYNHHPEIWVKVGGIDTGGGTGHGTTDMNRWMEINAAYGIYYASMDYLAAHPEQGRLCMNDMALPFGGKFDIQQNWNSPHAQHDRGKAVDVGDATAGQCMPTNSGIPLANRIEFRQMCVNRGAIAGLSYFEPAHVHCGWGLQ